MNGAVLLALSCVLFYLAYHVYGRLVERVFGVDPVRQTPAHTLRDGVDYVPTQPAILFGHHFASIAGAGPIVGPVLAAQFGWAAVALWIVLGCILIGSVHDLAAMFLSIRHQGRSIGTVIESLMGYWGRMLFLFFCWFTLVLVVAEFLRIVAETFVEIPAVATASLLFIGLAVPAMYAAWTLFGKKARGDHNPMTTMTYAFGIAALVLLPLQFFTEQPFPVSGKTLLWFAAFVGIATVPAFPTYTWGLGKLPASVASILAMSEIAFVALYAMVLLGERLSGSQLLGAILVIVGVLILSWPGRGGRGARDGSRSD